MKSNLIPTLVVDKKGRYTTVYRKPVEVADKSSTFPSPSSVLSQRKQRTILLMVSQLFAMKHDEISEVAKNLSGYSPDFLDTVTEALDDENLTTAIARLIHDRKSEREVGEAIRFLPHMDMTGFTGSLSLIKTLHGYSSISGQTHYVGLPEADDYSRADKVVQSQCEAILRVSCAIRNCSPEWYEWMQTVDLGDGDATMIMNDERLIKLVLERHDAVSLIEETIFERESADYDVISGVLENALGEGSL